MWIFDTVARSPWQRFGNWIISFWWTSNWRLDILFDFFMSLFKLLEGHCWAFVIFIKILQNRYFLIDVVPVIQQFLKFILRFIFIHGFQFLLEIFIKFLQFLHLFINLCSIFAQGEKYFHHILYPFVYLSEFHAFGVLLDWTCFVSAVKIWSFFGLHVACFVLFELCYDFLVSFFVVFAASVEIL